MRGATTNRLGLHAGRAQQAIAGFQGRSAIPRFSIAVMEQREGQAEGVQQGQQGPPPAGAVR